MLELKGIHGHLLLLLFLEVVIDKLIIGCCSGLNG